MQKPLVGPAISFRKEFWAIIFFLMTWAKYPINVVWKILLLLTWEQKSSLIDFGFHLL